MARARRIIAAEIDRFAHFRQCIGNGFLCLLHGDRHQGRTMLLQQVSQAIEASGALFNRCYRPCRISRLCIGNCRRDIAIYSSRNGGHHCDLAADVGQYRGIFQVQPFTVRALWHEQFRWQADRGMAGSADFQDLLDWIGKQFVFADILICQLVDKAAVRPIF